MSVVEQRPMGFELHRLPTDGSDERWQWAVYSFPGFAFLRDGLVAGDRDKAERAARASIAIMGGTVEQSEPAHAPSGGGTYRAVGRSRPEVDDP